MAFDHLAGVTTPGAPDEVVDWFGTFETWITSVGWTVAAGTGTTDLFLSSPGEAGGLTMLYVHIWRGAGANINRVYLEVCDDAVAPLGTHHTTRGGYVDSGGVQFAFFMSADKDAIVIVFKAGAGYRKVYGGLVYPWALTVPDETYHMIATSDMANGSILRRHDNLWDQDDTLFGNDYCEATRYDPDDGSLAIGGVYFADHADVAGQLKHISCEITEPAANPEDTLPTGQTGATTEWIILQDHTPRKFALRTGGILPTGRADSPSFAHVNGVAASDNAFYVALGAFLTGRGWTATQITPTNWEFNSIGEDGTDDIWIRIQTVGVDIWLWAADAAFGTPGIHQTTQIDIQVNSTDFPTQYYVSGDKECFVFTLNVGASYYPVWAGRISVVAPNLSSPYMKSGIARMGAGFLVLGHSGVWNRALTDLPNGDGVHCTLCNPNNYDGVTYIVWPHFVREAMDSLEPVGQLKYFFATSGGGVAILDTITVGAVVYTVFFIGATPWAMRTT